VAEVSACGWIASHTWSGYRANRILVAVRGFLAFAVVAKQVPASVMDQIYEMGDSRDLPTERAAKIRGCNIGCGPAIE
jgi:hypothetical protein